MASEPIRDPAKYHLLTPKKAGERRHELLAVIRSFLKRRTE